MVGNMTNFNPGCPLVSLLLHKEGINTLKQPLKVRGCIYMCGSYLVLIEVCNDDAYKQSEPNHAAQKHKDVDVDAVDLQAQRYLKCYRVLKM